MSTPLQKLCALLSQDDRATILQAITEGAASEKLRQSLRRGLYYSPRSGVLERSSDSLVREHVHHVHRGFAATTIARRTGLLDGITELRFRCDNLDSFEFLRGLTTLSTLRIGAETRGLNDLSPLSDLPLRTLSLASASTLTDLRGLPDSLTSLHIAHAPLSDLSPLPRFTNLTSLRLIVASRLTDLRPLASLAGLSTLVLYDCPDLTDLCPLAGLTGLRELELHGLTKLTDLRPLSALTQLTALRLYSCDALRDLAPLDGLRETNLHLCDSLQIPRSEQRRSAIARLRIVDGHPQHGTRRLTGDALAEVIVPGDHLRGVRFLSLDGSDITDLTPLASVSTLTHLSLTRCRKLREVFALIPMRSLTRLDLSGATAIRPRPHRTGLAGPADIEKYRARLIQALKQEPDRSLREERWLAQAAAHPASGTSPQPLTHRQTMQHIWSLLGTGDPGTVLQGIELAAALPDEKIRPELLRGFHHGRHLKLYADSTLRKKVGGGLAVWAGLHLLRRYGLLDAYTDLRHTMGDVPDLSFLAGLASLRAYSQEYVYTLNDLSALPSLPALERLTLRHAEGLTELVPLAQTRLTSLTLMDAVRLTELAPLADMVSLKTLNLVRCSALTDLGPLRRLTRLTHLSLRGCRSITDLSPLADMTQLQVLDLSECPGLTDLGPMRRMAALEQLVLERSPNITDLSPLDALAKLHTINDHGLTGVTRAEQRRSAIARVQVVGGVPCHGGRPLQGKRLAAVLVPGPHLTNTTTITIAYSDALLDLDALADHPTITHVEVTGCRQLADVFGLIPLTNLSRLILSACPAVRPRPPRVELSGDDVARYRAALARALRRQNPSHRFLR